MEKDDMFEFLEKVRETQPYLIISIPPGALIKAVKEAMREILSGLEKTSKKEPDALFFPDGMTIVKIIQRYDVGQNVSKDAEA